jgi:hypothetical protein
MTKFEVTLKNDRRIEVDAQKYVEAGTFLWFTSDAGSNQVLTVAKDSVVSVQQGE